MAYANKRRKARGGLSLKTPRTPVSAYRYAVTTKNIVFVTIILAVIVVAVAAICVVLLNPKRQVPMKFESVARNYYENVFYEKVVNSDAYSGNPEKALEKYHMAGMSPITLRVLHLMDESNPDTQYLIERCDPEYTEVRLFPEPPYTKTSYRAEYSYSCNY